MNCEIIPKIIKKNLNTICFHKHTLAAILVYLCLISPYSAAAVHNTLKDSNLLLAGNAAPDVLKQTHIARLTDSAPRMHNRPKIGLALSGGGARGIAHVGVLKILEEAGIRVDYITGTSMGGIIGGLYAIGYSADHIAKIVREINWMDLFTDKVLRHNLSLEEKADDGKFIWSLPMKNFHIMLPSGAIPGQKVFTLFSRLTWSVHHVEDFSQFTIPFRCIATDIVTGEPVVLKKGFLPEAMRATMSIPSAFNPIELDGRLLVDGGIVRNLPASDVKDMGADIIIGVNVGTSLYKKEELNSFVKILLQTTSFQETKSTAEESKLCDILIAPELDEYSMVSFDAVDSLIVRGERAARFLLPQLKAGCL